MPLKLPPTWRRYSPDDTEVAVEAGGHFLSCKHCSHFAFLRRDAYTRPAGVLGQIVDWLNYRARVDLADAPLAGYVCAKCGFLHWFAESATRPLLEKPPDQIREWECLACGASISPASDRCGACGWSYKTNDVERP